MSFKLRSTFGFLVLIFFSGASYAQEAPAQKSLADIQGELEELATLLSSLKDELVQSGNGFQSAPDSTIPPLDRLSIIERKLYVLTGQTEAIELRLNRVIKDATNKIGDLEFRLCELTSGCDIQALLDISVLGEKSTQAVGSNDFGNQEQAELAIGEENDFEKAQNALSEGDYIQAAELFNQFTHNYPDSPLGQKAHYNRGEALALSGDMHNAARAYLDAFSGAPNGPEATKSLLRLGTILFELGQTVEACLSLNEIIDRFPDDVEAMTAAQGEITSMGCFNG